MTSEAMVKGLKIFLQRKITHQESFIQARAELQMMYPGKKRRASLARPDEGVRAYVVPGIQQH